MSDEILTVSNSDYGVFAIYNLVKKEYSDGSVKFKKTSFDTIVGQTRINRHDGSFKQDQLDRLLKQRVKERREKITDLALNNSWSYFITLTFDPGDKKYFPNGYSHEVAIELLTKWIDNQKHQNKSMSYILVSEFHKESGNLHFHGLFSNVPKWKLSEAINSKTGKKIFKAGIQIYNLDNYKFGWTTISHIKDSERVSYYLSKYVTKEILNIKHKKTFWYSKDLVKPSKTYHYIDSTLKDYLENDRVSYYDSFISDNRTIEIANYSRQHNFNKDDFEC